VSIEVVMNKGKKRKRRGGLEKRQLEKNRGRQERNANIEDEAFEKRGRSEGTSPREPRKSAGKRTRAGRSCSDRK